MNKNCRREKFLAGETSTRWSFMYVSPPQDRCSLRYSPHYRRGIKKGRNTVEGLITELVRVISYASCTAYSMPVSAKNTITHTHELSVGYCIFLIGSTLFCYCVMLIVVKTAATARTIGWRHNRVNQWILVEVPL